MNFYLCDSVAYTQYIFEMLCLNNLEEGLTFNLPKFNKFSSELYQHLNNS